eukprot:366428-Chlamydomonas_euryale.AAC.6
MQHTQVAHRAHGRERMECVRPKSSHDALRCVVRVSSVRSDTRKPPALRGTLAVTLAVFARKLAWAKYHSIQTVYERPHTQSTADYRTCTAHSLGRQPWRRTPAPHATGRGPPALAAAALRPAPALATSGPPARSRCTACGVDVRGVCVDHVMCGTAAP